MKWLQITFYISMLVLAIMSWRDGRATSSAATQVADTSAIGRVGMIPHHYVIAFKVRERVDDVHRADIEMHVAANSKQEAKDLVVNTINKMDSAGVTKPIVYDIVDTDASRWMCKVHTTQGWLATVTSTVTVSEDASDINAAVDLAVKNINAKHVDWDITDIVQGQ